MFDRRFLVVSEKSPFGDTLAVHTGKGTENPHRLSSTIDSLLCET